MKEQYIFLLGKVVIERSGKHSWLGYKKLTKRQEKMLHEFAGINYTTGAQNKLAEIQKILGIVQPRR